MIGRIEVVPGGHLVACVDGVVFVVAHRDPEPVTADSEAVVVLNTLAELVQEAASRETQRTGRTFARLVSKWLMGREDEERVEFGVLTPGARGVALFLHGGVTAVFEDADRCEVLHGRDAGFSIDRVVVPAPSRAAALFVDGETPRVELPAPGVWTLRAGLVPGDGAVLWLDEKTESSSRPESPAPSREHSRAVQAKNSVQVDALRGLVNGAQVDHHAPADGRAEAGSARGPAVRGFKCERQHLNDPRVVFCTQCGVRMDHLTSVLTEGVRPPLGLLLLDDGTSYVLDANLVIGREPERSDQVRRGAHAVRISNASAGMSRVHAEIRLVDWDVLVVDRGSANGTHIQQPGRPEWLRATPGHPTVLEHGARVTLGGRVFTFDAQHGHL